MSEYLATHLTIGGPILKRHIPRLFAAIGRENLSLNWGEALFSPQSAADLLDARIETGAALVLRLYDEQARWGQFEELERLLIRWQIAFNRQNEGKYEINPEWVAFRPGLGTFAFSTNSQEQIVVEAEALWPLAIRLTAARRAVRQGKRSSALRELTAMSGVLRRALPPRPLPLTPFEIVLKSFRPVGPLSSDTGDTAQRPDDRSSYSTFTLSERSSP